MKPTPIGCVLLSSLLFACGGPVESTASTSQAITSGNARADDVFGAGLVDAPGTACSSAFLAPDLVLTHARCLGGTKVTVAGKTYDVELGRSVSINKELATLQLKKQVPATVFNWTPTRTRVTSTDVLTCFGFDVSRVLTSGTFRVVDLSGEAIFLQGGSSFPGTFGVAPIDDGGFCIRDGSFEIVATLAAAPAAPGAPRAVQVDTLGKGVNDLMAAVVQARSQWAITLVNDPNAASPAALTLSGTALIPLSRVARDPSQAFYLARGAAPDLVSLVNANTGLCVFGSGVLAGARSCNFASTSQQWKMESFQAFPGPLKDAYRFRLVANPALCLSVGGSPLVPCTLAAANFGMWLNAF